MAIVNGDVVTTQDDKGGRETALGRECHSIKNL